MSNKDHKLNKTSKTTFFTRLSDLFNRIFNGGNSGTSQNKSHGKTSNGTNKSRADKPSGDRKEGIVKFFNGSKGFGFIREESGNEIFVHASGLKSRIRDNDRVLYEASNGKNGLTAINVTRVKSAKA